MFDFRLGPSFGVLDASGAQFRMDMDFGVRVAHPGHSNIYLVAPLDFGFGSGKTIISCLPGIEADIALPVGQPLFIYPKLGLGVGISTGGSSDQFSDSGDTSIAFGIRFGFGIKYVLDGMWSFSFEPFNFELYPVGFDNTPGYYNLMFGAGLDF